MSDAKTIEQVLDSLPNPMQPAKREAYFAQRDAERHARWGGAVPAFAAALAELKPSALKSAETPDADPDARLGTVIDITKPIPKLRRLIQGLPFHFEAVNAIVGYAGDGKTPLLTSMIVSLAAGVPWFGREVQQGSVILLTYEAPLSVARHIQRYAEGIGVNYTELPIKVLSCNPGALRDPEYVRYIRENVAPRYSYIAIDTYGAGMTGADFNDAEFATAAKGLELHGAAVIMAVHTNKANEMPTLKSISGTGALAGAVKAAIGIWRPLATDRELFEIVKVRSPDNGFAPWRCKINDNGNTDGPWCYDRIEDDATGTADGAGMTAETLQPKIVRLFEGTTEWQSRRDLVEKLQAPAELLNEACKNLTEDEILSRSTKGGVPKWRRGSKFPKVPGTLYSATTQPIPVAPQPIVPFVVPGLGVVSRAAADAAGYGHCAEATPMQEPLSYTSLWAKLTTADLLGGPLEYTVRDVESRLNVKIAKPQEFGRVKPPNWQRVESARKDQPVKYVRKDVQQ